MALPKRRHSKQRTRKRRAAWKLKLVALSTCPQCHEAKLPHRVCRNCGWYRGRQAVAVEAAED